MSENETEWVELFWRTTESFLREHRQLTRRNELDKARRRMLRNKSITVAYYHDWSRPRQPFKVEYLKGGPPDPSQIITITVRIPARK